MSEGERCLLAVEAPAPSLARRSAPGLVALAAAAAALGTIEAGSHGALPWVPVEPFRDALLHEGTIVLVTLLGAAALARAWWLPRLGRVAFFPERILFVKPGTSPRWRRGEAESVAWTDVSGFRDGSTEYVQIVRKGDVVASAQLTIPTPSEVERTAVLELLAARGVARLDG